MPSLQDSGLQDAFVRRCVPLWKNWLEYSGPHGLAHRTQQWQLAISPALQSCNIPVPPIRASHGSFLVPANWSIDFGYNQNNLDINWFARGAITLYHEARHAEQWFRIAQAIASGVLPLPANWGTAPPRTRAVTANDISIKCGIPQSVANHAFATRQTFPVQMTERVREWFESIYSSARQHRGEVLNHMSQPGAWSPYENPTPNPNFAQYLNLPEEKDAFKIQDEVLARLSNALRMWQ
jgi:hypothetical protein